MVRLARALLQAASQMPAAHVVREHLLPPVAKLSEQVVSHGKGSYVWTTDGTKLLDMACAIGVLSTGYCHPKVVGAIQQQAGQLIHAGQNIFAANKPLVELLDKMQGIMPGDHLSRFFFCNSGSEAVDNAIKIARAATGKQNIIAFNGGYHGRTYGSMAVTTSKTIYRQMYGPLMPGVAVSPYPYCHQCEVRRADPESDYQVAPPVEPVGPETWTCCGAPERALDWLLQMQTHPNETAAMIIEPIQGEGGFVVPPRGFLKQLRHVCDANGILLIVDEVQSGVGRTGKWWAIEHFEECKPDILVFAKGICSGYPFAGLATRPDLYDNMKPGSMGGTYGANALGCAVASATIDAIKEDGMLENAAARGVELMTGLLAIKDKGYPVADIRGKGLMVAVEFGGPHGELDAPYGIAVEVMKACREKGLIIMTAGARESVRFLPPLNVSASEIKEALEKFEAACHQVFHVKMVDQDVKPGKPLVG